MSLKQKISISKNDLVSDAIQPTMHISAVNRVVLQQVHGRYGVLSRQLGHNVIGETVVGQTYVDAGGQFGAWMDVSTSVHPAQRLIRDIARQSRNS